MITPAFQEEDWELFVPRGKGGTSGGGTKRRAAEPRGAAAKRRRITYSKDSSEEGEEAPVELSDDEVEHGTPEEQRALHDAAYPGDKLQTWGLPMLDRERRLLSTSGGSWQIRGLERRVMGPVIDPDRPLTPIEISQMRRKVADLGIPLETEDWALHLQSGRWVNRLVYNASQRLPTNHHIDVARTRTQEELGRWLSLRLIERNRLCREVVFRPPPKRPAVSEVARAVEEAQDWQVERIRDHEWNDYTGRLVFLLEWTHVRDGREEESWERNASVLELQVLYEYLLRRHLVGVYALLAQLRHLPGSEERIREAHLRVRHAEVG